MSIILFILSLFFLLWFFAQKNLSLSKQAIAFFVFGLFNFSLNTLGAGLSIILLAFTSVFLVIALVKPIRTKLLSDRVLKYIGGALPPISATEQAAIDAGTVWWEAELFRGNPDWDKLHNIPYARLSDEEQAFIDGPVEQLCSMIDDWQITHELNDLPEEVWAFMKQEKFFGLMIPREYGGLGFSSMANSEIVMKVASRSGSAGVTVMVPNSLGPGELLLEHGTDEQKDYYLPRLANGEEVPCFALTGPWAGSDAGAMMDAGVVCEREIDGKKVIGFNTSWNKRYITLAPVATLVGLAFKAYDPDGLLGDKEDLGITCALIPSETDGVTIGNRHLPLNASFMNGPIQGVDVFIPLDWIIGGSDGVGHGWQMLMEALAAGRAISLPASGASMCKVAAWSTGAYANIREQFGLPIGKFEAVEEALTRIAGKTYMLDSTRLFTLAGLMQGEKPSVVSAIAKLHLTKGGREVVNDAMDIHGGKGICMGPSNYLARAYQMLPIGITVEGANIITRSLIIFGQGAMRCHPYLLSEIQLASEQYSKEVSNKFDSLLCEHIAYVAANKSRAFLYGLTRGKLAPMPNTPASKNPERKHQVAIYYKKLASLSAAFAFIADTTLLVLGGEFKRKEKISARLGDALSYMFMCSSVLKRYKDSDYNEEDIALVEWSCQHSLHLAENALNEVLKNYPVSVLGKILSFIVFPTGTYCPAPDDYLGAKVAKTIQKPCGSRDRITHGIYINQDKDDVLGCIDNAFKLSLETKDLRKSIKQHEHKAYLSIDQWLESLLEKSVITQQEHDLLHEYYQAVYQVIRVDDFSQSELTR